MANDHMAEHVLFDEKNLLLSLDKMLADFEAVFGNTKHHRLLDVAGATIDVGCNDIEYLDQASRALAARQGSHGKNCKIAVLNADDAACRIPVWTPTGFPEREIEAFLADTPYKLHYFDTLNFWQIFDTERSIGIQWMTAKDAFPPWDPGSPLRNFVQWHLGSETISLLHSGTLALSDSGVLLAGEGGAGKSSTVLAGIFGGLQSVGDDYVLVDINALTARPVFDTLKQDETGLRRLGQWEHSAIPALANWQGKHQFYMTEVVSDPLPASIALRAILLPELTYGNNTYVTPVGAKEAFLALAPSGVSQIHCDRARLFNVAGSVARKLPAYRLSLGTDPDEIVDAIRSFLEEI